MKKEYTEKEWLIEQITSIVMSGYSFKERMEHRREINKKVKYIMSVVDTYVKMLESTP